MLIRLIKKNILYIVGKNKSKISIGRRKQALTGPFVFMVFDNFLLKTIALILYFNRFFQSAL